MNRKHFISLSAASIGNLLLPITGFGDMGKKFTLDEPFKVLIRMDEGLHQLKKVRNGAWHYRDVVVTLGPTGKGTEVVVYAPGAALHEVLLQWNYPAEKDASLLGDHWERTYGDVGFAPATFHRKMPWYFIQVDPGNEVSRTACLGVATGCATICYWQVGNGVLQLTMNTQNGGSGVHLGTRELTCAEIIATKAADGENPFETGRRFCSLLCAKPRLPVKPVYGINDWYYAYGDNSADLILEGTKRITELATNNQNRPFSVVDAGWAAYSPLLPGDCCWQDDFSRPNEKFGDMQRLAGEIHQLGMRPGLWTRPLCGAHDDPHSLLLPVIPGRDDKQKPVLDPTIPENIARIQRNIALYHQWGFELVKHDFSTYDIFGKWGFEMTSGLTAPGWRMNDNTRTNAEIILHLYRSIREAAGEMYVLGCNTMGHLGAGIFELNRIGDDTSGKEWDRTRKMGVNTLGFRMVQHKTFYSADGDCVGLTDKIPWRENKQWMQLLAESSTPLFISAQPAALGIGQRNFIRECFATAARELPVGEPLDWLSQQRPGQWRLDGKVRSFDWS